MIISLGLLPGDMHRLAYRTHPVPRAGREMFWLARSVGKGPFNLVAAILGRIG